MDNGYDLADEVFRNISLNENHEISLNDAIRVISFWGFNEEANRTSKIGFVCYCAREKIKKAFESALILDDFTSFDGEMRHGDWENHEEECQRRCEAFVVAETLLKQNIWIPVSKGLPKSAGVYNVTCEITNRFNERIHVTDAYYFCYGKWYNDNRVNDARKIVDNEVKAWMPLPEPFVESEGII